MDSLVEAKVKDFLTHAFHYDPYQCGAVLYNIRELARASGYALDARFARAGLAAGPEGAVAATVVERALGGTGSATSEYALRSMIDGWVRRTAPKGR